MISKCLSVAALVTLSGVASADILASYSYSDLDGSFDAQSGLFTAFAADNADLTSGGDVSRLAGPKSTAEFDTAFLGFGLANVEIQMEVFNITPTSADAAGTLSLTDIDGDVLTASFAGTWAIVNPFGFMFFNGVSSDYEFLDNGTQDASFDGTTGSFSLAGLLNNIYDGALSILLRNPGGFGADFTGVSTEADGILIPAPGVLALAGVGLLSMGKRRRG